MILNKQSYKMKHEMHMSDNITVDSYTFCCLYYFYYGKAFNDIKTVIVNYTEYIGIFYGLNGVYNIQSLRSEDSMLYRKFMYTLDIDHHKLFSVIRKIHGAMVGQTINIKDMPECIKECAIKHEKALYW